MGLSACFLSPRRPTLTKHHRLAHSRARVECPPRPNIATVVARKLCRQLHDSTPPLAQQAPVARELLERSPFALEASHRFGYPVMSRSSISRQAASHQSSGQPSSSSPTATHIERSEPLAGRQLALPGLDQPSVFRFDYVADGFVAAPNSRPLYSPYYVFAGYQWRLRVYPYGKRAHRHVSIYLECGGVTGCSTPDLYNGAEPVPDASSSAHSLQGLRSPSSGPASGQSESSSPHQYHVPQVRIVTATPATSTAAATIEEHSSSTQASSHGTFMNEHGRSNLPRARSGSETSLGAANVQLQSSSAANASQPVSKLQGQSASPFPVCIRIGVSLVHPFDDDEAMDRQGIVVFKQASECHGFPRFERLSILKNTGIVRIDGSVHMRVEMAITEQHASVGAAFLADANEAVSARTTSAHQAVGDSTPQGVSPMHSCGDQAPAQSRGRKRVPPLAMLAEPDSSHADVSLQGCEAGATVIRAHKCILSAGYEFFATLLSGHYRDGSSASVIQFDDISSESLRIVINFVYGAELPPALARNLDALLEIWQFATVRFMEDLAAECATILVDEITPSTFVPCFRQARQLGATRVVAKLAAELHCMLEEKSSQADITELSCEEMEDLIKDMPPTFHTCDLIRVWLDCQPSRSEFGFRLFQAFELDDLPASDLQQCERYAFARRFVSSATFYRIVQKLSAGADSKQVASKACSGALSIRSDSTWA